MNACTIIARNYLAQARVLADSFVRHHPGRRLSVLVIDGDVAPLEREEPFDVVLPSQLPLEAAEFRRMATIYTPVELATAVKPWLLRHLLDGEGVSAVVYLDPDIEVFAPLDELDELAGGHGLVLVPHLLAPIPADGRGPSQEDIARAGVYNLGFVAVSPKAEGFLAWWGERLLRDCIVAPDEGLFVDQRLLDFAPAYFEHHVLRDPGYDVAYWNLHERDVVAGDEGYEVEGCPLRFFHYSGFDPLQPHLLSRHQGPAPRIVLSERPVLARLCRDYADQLLAAGYREAIAEPYGYGRTASGLELDARRRRLYREVVLAREVNGAGGLPSPFDAAESDVFADWVRSPRSLQSLPPLARARFLLQAGPDVASPRWWAPLARRLVLRVLRHSNRHHHVVQWALIEAISQLEAKSVEGVPSDSSLLPTVENDSAPVRHANPSTVKPRASRRR